jgi:sugar O-acyltransferase (sialic acid O-acetyltransferase NeuD family)
MISNISENTKDIIIINNSNFGTEIAWLIEQINEDRKQWNILGFVDDNAANAVANSYPFLGDVDWLIKYPEPVCVACAIGNPGVRRRVVSRVSVNSNVRFPVLIAPDVRRSSSIDYGEGAVICSGTILTVNINIGAHVVVNLDCTVGHGAVIKDFCTLSPSVNISGNVTVGSGVLIGVGANIIEERMIGENSVIGAGAVVTMDIDPNCTAVGIPAKPIKYHDEND